MDVIRTQRQVEDLLTAQCKRIFHGLPLTGGVKAHMMRVCETSCPELNSQKVVTFRGAALCVDKEAVSRADTEEKILLAARGRF
jgi:hypothetical protein